MPPPDEKDVRPWAEAAYQIKDPLKRVMALMTIQYGWRPSHCTGVRWSNIKYDEQGKMMALVNDGSEGLFKRRVPVIVALFPDVAEALEELKELIEPGPNDLIIPNVGMKGKHLPKPRLSTRNFEKHWDKVEKKYDLPHLTPKDFRHYVDMVCVAEYEERTGLKRIARARMMGHEHADPIDKMGARYNNLDWELVIENQKAIFPTGPVGHLLRLRMLVEDDTPPEIRAAWQDYKAGKLRPSTLPDIFNDALRAELRKQTSVKLEA